ncbi:MAG: DEAD/DEAH box helicase family protein, partial [Candidatus Doudnabacteria bacterium]|nr:DEAD/DEAH box helicase family protein [Candidatus Doudnabacteria bacterium]
MVSPNDKISALPKTGPTSVRALQSIGIETVSQLLTYYPSRYLDFSKFTFIQDLQAGEVVTIRGSIKSMGSRFAFPTRKTISEALISDTTGSLKVTWFNQGYIAQTLKKGDEVLLSGKVDYYKNLLQLTNPVYEKVGPEHLHTGRLVPLYKLPEGVFPKSFRALVNASLAATHALEDIIPASVRNTYRILDIPTATRELHFPSSPELLLQAKTRLAFEESFIQQLAVEQHKLNLQALAAPNILTDIVYIKSQLAQLPFHLTNGQKKALWQILQDLEHKHPMNLLLQGDVGSGKTIVALLAALQVIQNGYQVALLVPTEILAKQHFEGIAAQLKHLGSPAPKIGLLTRSFQNIGTRASTRA